MKKYINMDRKLLKSGGRKSLAISKEEFLNKLLILHQNDEKFMESNKDFNIENFKEENISFKVINRLSKVKKDLSKVWFDTENNYISNIDTPIIEPNGALLGIHTLDNGFTFLGCMAGGDWEKPLYFIVYFDGKDFRGYIPSYGNVYNLDFKTALGSEEECEKYDSIVKKKGYLEELKGVKISDIYLKRQGLEKGDIPVVNWSAVKEDIINRIEIK